MPLRLRHILDRLPLPSLRHYTLISTSLFVGSLFYYHHLLQTSPMPTSETLGNETRVFSDAKPWSLAYIQTLISVIVSQSVSLLILVNAIYCSIGLCGKYIQEWIFGELRLVELQRIKEKFWNYAFYKFCFLFGVLGIQSLNELAVWTLWFSVVAFSLLLCQLSKDRFELLSVSASIRRQPLLKILGLLVGLLVLSCVQLATCFLIGFPYGGLSIFCFMLAEASLLTLEIGHLLFNYTFQYYVYEQQKHNPLIPSNEYRSYIVYYIEFFYHMLTLIIDIVHHMQMLFYHQTFMSMTSLILFMQLRPLFHELTQRLKRHKIYRSTMIRMEKKYPLMTKHDLEQKYLKQNYISSLEEVCSICWEKFEKARCLPCGHLFHQNCLRGWLEQDTTCPICRLPLQEEPSQQPTAVVPPPPTAAPPTPNFLQWPTLTLARFARNAHGRNDGTGQRPARNHLFRFDGSRYSSWLPTFSIEINHNFPLRLGRARLTGEQLAGMAQHVQQVFPQIPYEAIVLDLQRTQSIDMTIENIIEHRIRIDLPPTGQQQDVSGSEDTSYTSSEASSSDVGEPIDTDLLSEMPQTTHTEDLVDSTETDNFAWPLDPQLPIAVRKQHLIAHMRKQFLDRERRLQASSSKSDLLSDR